jgi:Kae1-associated kinase Bud32
LAQEAIYTQNELHRQILDFSKHAAGSAQITAVCQSDDYAIEVPSAKSTVEVIIIIHDFQPRLMSYVKIIEGRNIVFFAVDQWVFERDIDRGLLGEALASRLIFPYTGLINAKYLKLQEIALKKRLIIELLENMVISYPEFSYSIHIKPEYFMYEVMLNRVRVFPPLSYGASHFLIEGADKEKIETVLHGYIEALNQLAKEGTITYSSDEVMISEKFVDASKNPRVRIVNTVKNAPRRLFTSLFGLFPQFLNFLAQNAEAFFSFQMLPWKNGFDFAKNFVNPQKFVFVPTAQGLISLADKMDIRGYVQKVLSADYDIIEVNEFGGVLNDVYLISACTDHSEKKVLVKRFKDLYSFKWFPLSMWSVGARSFALLGKSRLERECAINEFLDQHGFRVPKVLHVSANERLVFMEYVEGENLSNTIKKIAKTPDPKTIAPELNLITQAGTIYAKVHALNIVLGDAKPDNIIVSPNEQLCLIDFEQASHKGDKTWDIAEFLYYSGHYLPLNGEHKAKALADAFIAGYLAAGGDLTAVKTAGVTKYTRVFSIFTLPGILREMASICKKTQPRK